MIDTICLMIGCTYLGYLMRYIQETGLLKL